ncbi:hypothetical protein VDF90_07405 [Xanthomonas campestris pv. raphani]|uniref:hypothetical protein n=1 Tax=Xanthomonas campestris TaxID=339 RepID=UPI002B2352FF|nr:hypothetical protein [Xanthomonas campestris]MEA9787076.1 hypothetical protein [Xanthomonas campestris pv. raphani]
MADSPSVEWSITARRVWGGPRIYILTIVVNRKPVEQNYFLSRKDAEDGRDAAMEFYRG